MQKHHLRTLLIFLLAMVTGFIGYLDFMVGFGFHLFPLYLVPLALVAWRGNLPTTLALSIFAGSIIVSKIFFTKHLYGSDFYWYWDGLVKFSLLQILSYGLWKIRQLTLAQKKLSDDTISELTRSLRTQVEQLTAINRELEDFSYTISHDLRAPIRHIIGFVDMLNTRDLSSLDQKSRHYLQVITEAAGKMGELIDALLAYSRLGRTELVPSRVDVDKLVREMVQKLTESEKEREIHWEISPLPSVIGDAEMLRQVFANILKNSVKFTRTRSPARIVIGATDQAEETVFFVEDNGVGFDNRYVQKLFGMFHRLHGAEEFEGIGAGLALVERIVLRHGGRVWAEGAVDRGATIWFSLPREGRRNEMFKEGGG